MSFGSRFSILFSFWYSANLRFLGGAIAPGVPPWLRLCKERITNIDCLESNEALKLKFRKLHATVVNNVNPANVINFLFQEAVVGDVDTRDLVNIADPQQQCTKLLMLLHTSENPQAFVQLYLAIKEEPHLQWLIERIDNFTDQSLIDLLQQQKQKQQQQQQQQQMSISKPTVPGLLQQGLSISTPKGECVF